MRFAPLWPCGVLASRCEASGSVSFNRIPSLRPSQSSTTNDFPFQPSKKQAPPILRPSSSRIGPSPNPTMSVEPPAQNNVSSAYPPPPPFYKHFTPENIAALQEHRKNGTPEDQIPKELQYLIPPPPPQRIYRSFGETWMIPDVLPTLPQMGITQLYTDPTTTSTDSITTSPAPATASTTTSPPSNTRALSLLRLSKSLLLSYLELLSLLSVNPVASTQKVSDLRTIIINMHHLINEYRPHQARETLILMMEEQIEKSKREKEENQRASRMVRESMDILEAMLENGLGVERGEGVGGDKQEWRISHRRLADERERREDKVKDKVIWEMFDSMINPDSNSS
ncbi:MED7 protein-domain-containing protein [Peziza echinospora]|nr:MED7 protein-domain-containing protein [Peziza echinospora]